MATYGKVRLWSVSGEALIADYEEDEKEPYRRRTIGFLPIRERNVARGTVENAGSGDVGPPVCSCEQEPVEGIFMEVSEEEEKEVVQ